MGSHDWSLIIFTILAQMSVGAFVVLGVAHFYAVRKAGIREADRMSDLALLAIGPVLVLGLLASMFHLGQPFVAYRAINNLATSWLSREILFGILFAGSGFLFALLQWRKIGTPLLRNVLAWISAVLGLALVYSMARVYMIESQPAWNTMATVVSFFATSFLLGGLAIGSAFVINYAMVKRADPGCAEMQCSLLRTTLRGITVAAVILLGIELVTIPLLIAYLAGGGAAAQASASMLGNEFNLLQGLRLGLVFFGVAVLGLFLYQTTTTTSRERLMGNLTIAAFALVLAAEVIGRLLFYATHVKVGLS
jgi:anaerobic dimethyl sulfoxide reductase subunit C